MKKTTLFFLLATSCLAVINSSFVHVENKKVNVSVSPYPVTVNGIQYNNQSSDYPFLMFNDITYMPLTHGITTFTGLGLTFKKGINIAYHKDEMILHIGNRAITENDLEQYLKDDSNNSSCTALIPDYHTYISEQSEEYDNYSLYPIINFKGVTYLPLTWDIITLLDWDCSFDSERGLVIDSTNAVRPCGVNDRLFSRMAELKDEYILGRHYYLRYDINIYRSGRFLWVCGNETKEYSLQEQLRGKINYLNYIYKNGVLTKPETLPTIDENILTILCARGDFGQANILMTVDLDSGTVLQLEEL